MKQPYIMMQFTEVDMNGDLQTHNYVPDEDPRSYSANVSALFRITNRIVSVKKFSFLPIKVKLFYSSINKYILYAYKEKICWLTPYYEVYKDGKFIGKYRYYVIY